VTISSAAQPGLRSLFLSEEAQETVSKVSPGEFIRQVRAETAKVVWPSRKETMTTAVMVLIMVTILAIFFFGVDSFFSTIVQFLLRQLG
jgi:preprotein translocase subunit SecE